MKKPVVVVHDLNKASKQIHKINKKPFGVVDVSNPINVIVTEVSQFKAVVEELTGRESRHKSWMHSQIDLLFYRLLGEVNRLFTYPDWLPIERCQISFYSHQLSYLFKGLYQGSLNTCHEGYLSELLTDPTLNILVTRILVYKNLRTRSVDLLKCDQPPDLTPVADRLAFEVSLTFKKPWMQDSSKGPKDFAAIFYFDKNRFRENEEEVFIGFHEEVNILLQQLACITKKQLEVISIVGMAGNGKTTLARRLYNDPYVVSYFYLRAWVTCSQVYRKRDSLLSILKSVVEITDDEVCSMNDNMLAHALYRALKGKRYLIVIDDIWTNEAWDDLQRSFPNDNIGSRIMLTTRLNDVALHAQPDRNPFCLRFLTEKESFDLLKRKAFVTEHFFDDLSLIGKSIARKCRGLPLTVVVIAGLLKHKLMTDWWAQVEESVSSYIITDENQYMDTLALSYNHLPQHLRPCFLSFGAFPEGQDIPVCKLIRIWIAEGFMTPDGTRKSLEDVAEDYLMDLVSRSLIIAGKKGTNGAIKTCRIHDLLRDLCFRKAEDNFLPNIYNYNRHSHSLTNPLTGSQLLLSPNVLTVPSKCSSYSSGFFQSFFKDSSIGMETSKFIRVLDISSLELSVIPSELLQLVYLRYLEIRLRSSNLPETIYQLTELQTLIVSSKMNIVVPETTWKLLKLRHLCIKTGENLVNFCNEESSFLDNLQTMSLVSPTRLSPLILARTRNLRKLGLCGPLTTKSGELKLPELGLLMHLRILKLLNTDALCKAGKLSDSIMFPETLKSLTMSNTYLHWKEAWVFEMLPNLEVLKLKFHAFVGKDWETSPQALTHLKFLKLDELDFENWASFRNHFPVLQRLQVLRCPYLLEIPEDFGNICTLEWIELSGCSDAATNSAREIQKEQENNGNDWLKILVSPGLSPGKIYSQKHRSGY
ncbi:putative late blight resistance protein homolog R1A-3 [Apium graveolens]|uniref:putative late blight resistance protein homolog R1A-3 n=1 Tax=Apium graveolens TaxID=4045 RepID=UPI003D799240